MVLISSSAPGFRLYYFRLACCRFPPAESAKRLREEKKKEWGYQFVSVTLKDGRRMAKPSDRTEDGCLLIRVTGVDQGQPVVALDQESVCHPHRDDVHTFDHTLHGHD